MARLRRIFELFFTTSLIAPVILILLYLILLAIFKGANLSPRDIIAHATSIYSRYGYEIIFFGAFMEALVVINFFVPGVTLVVLGAVFARTGGIDLTWAVLSATTGAILGYIIDFFLGYFGFGQLLSKFKITAALTKAKSEVEKSPVKSFGLGFIHPDLGSFVALAAGTIKMNFINFLTLTFFSSLVWTSLWGLLVFAFGRIFLVVLTRYTTLLVILVVSIWTLWTMYENRGK